MAYMGNLQKGDRVRVTFEGDVVFGSSFGVDIKLSNGRTLSLREKLWPGVEFEKIEPPVEVFKPGDVVRHHLSRSVYALTNKGFVRLGGRGYMPYANGVEVPFNNEAEFTSENYDRVEVA